jgi:capsular polysaccharide export protein
VKKLGTFSPWALTTPALHELLGAEPLAALPRGAQAAELDAIVGFHEDANEAQGLAFATEHALPYLRLFPGCPLRAGLRGPAEAPLSVVVDTLQLSTSTPPRSSVEESLRAGSAATPQLLERARRLMQQLAAAGVHLPLGDDFPWAAGDSAEERFAAVYLLHAVYRDPETGAAWQAEDAVDCVQRQRAYFEANRGDIYCYGFTLWKRTFVRAYLRSPHNRVKFVRGALEARCRGFGPGARLLVWGVREEPDIAALAREQGVPIWRMEDGFLRSVGLGADLTIPASLVVDRQGIYFDPSGPSELESILQNEQLSEHELQRARALRELIVKASISKYNVGNQASVLIKPDHPRVILVPGQVEDDASIRLGCRDVRTNLDLLRAVREGHPHAHVIYKPHPDVTDAWRKGAIPREVALQYANQVLVGVPLPACLAIADEVHTMTSLVGFEALLRGLKVHCYGQPFYAGWGLTTDRHAVARRTRRLSLDELVACVLLRYPRYLGLRSRLFTTPEVIVAQLREQLAAAPSAPVRRTRLARELKRVSHVMRGVLDVP